MKVHDAETSVRQKASNTSVRRAKIEKMRLDHSATTIQSTWRGTIRRRAYRKIVPDLKSPTLASSNGVNYAKILPIDESIQNENNIEDADEGLSDAKSEVDDEEVMAIKAAENVEERLIMDASCGQLLPSWPQPLTDDFESKAWPDLESASSILGMLPCPKKTMQIVVDVALRPTNFYD